MRTVLLAIVMASAASADISGHVSLDTSALIGNPNGPFTLDFQLIDNTPGLNQATLSNFSVGTGYLSPYPTSATGGVNVQLSPFSVLLDGSSFVNDAQFAFSPGSSLGFDIDATTVVEPDPNGPDTFTFAILDQYGLEIPTTNGNGFDSFFEIDSPSQYGPASVQLSATDPNRTSIAVGAPALTFVPEPPERVCLVVGLGVLCGCVLRRRRLAR